MDTIPKAFPLSKVSGYRTIGGLKLTFNMFFKHYSIGCNVNTKWLHSTSIQKLNKQRSEKVRIFKQQNLAEDFFHRTISNLQQSLCPLVEGDEQPFRAHQ